MNISPVTFGKAVRVNGSMSEAFDIARLANEKKVPRAERTAQKQAQAIFNDTAIAPAKVVTYQTHLGNNVEDIYVVSGKEAQATNDLYEKMVAGIIDTGNSSESKEEFQSSCKKIQDKHNNILGKILHSAKPNYELNVTYDKRYEAVKSVNKQLPAQRRLLELSL